MNTASSSQAEAIYRKVREDVIQWEHRMGRQEIPLDGSVLDADDKALIGAVPSELARLALVSGTEALQLVRETLDRRRVYVSATNGPIRTALLGASHAVYLLSPDDTEVRRERQRFAQRAYYSNMSSYLRERTSLEPEPELAKMIEFNTGQIAALNEALGDDGRGRPRKATTDTEVIRESSKGFGEKNANILMQHWRRLSGDAHALGWQLLMDGVKKQRSAGHLFEGVLASDEANTYRHFISAATMLKRGWSLFDQRSDVN